MWYLPPFTANPLTTPSPVLAQVSNLPTTASTQPGLVLSPAAEPLPRRLVEKIVSRQFVEMKELLSDNISLLSHLETVQGLTSLELFGGRRPRMREVTSLPMWCFLLPWVCGGSSRNMLAYGRLLIREANRHDGQGWMDYDQAFRQQVAVDPSLPWNTLHPGLQAATILGQHSGQGQGLFCTLCRGSDHSGFSVHCCACSHQLLHKQQTRHSGDVLKLTFASPGTKGHVRFQESTATGISVPPARCSTRQRIVVAHLLPKKLAPFT